MTALNEALMRRRARQKNDTYQLVGQCLRLNSPGIGSYRGLNRPLIFKEARA